MGDLPETRSLDLELTGGWLSVWFNSPEENRNALTDQRASELRALCYALEDRRDIRGVTFRGRGGVFCAGGDLKNFKQAVSGNPDREATLTMSRGAGKLYGAVNALPQVTLMAIEGACVAGGLGLASCGDIVIADTTAKFSLSEVRIGLSPAQIAPFVSARVGMANMRRLALTGAIFGAGEAIAIGLADEVVEGTGAMNMAIGTVVEQTLNCAPNAVAATKRLLLELPTLDRAEQIDRAAEIFTACMFSAEGREGLAAFSEKRKPGWQAINKETA